MDHPSHPARPPAEAQVEAIGSRFQVLVDLEAEESIFAHISQLKHQIRTLQSPSSRRAVGPIHQQTRGKGKAANVVSHADQSPAGKAKPSSSHPPAHYRPKLTRPVPSGPLSVTQKQQQPLAIMPPPSPTIQQPIQSNPAGTSDAMEVEATSSKGKS